VRLNHALEINLLVRAVAKWLRFGMAAAAETYLGPAAETENFAILIDDLKIAFDSN
jgi:hypothetical protein